ncbi:MAG TPA: hypothetical protein PK299_12505 [Anaerolineales bacterium]|nr:hypothetical protein [Anaerolineales bacterium]
MPARHNLINALLFLAILAVGINLPLPTQAAIQYPILFVTQVPVAADFTTIGSTFGNHMADVRSVVRGGDLWIRYPNGNLKNLTQAAGYGVTGLQVGNAIAVRDPAVSWDASKAIFSMVVGAPSQYQTTQYRWQMYEITGLGEADTPLISLVPNQPSNYNNVMPIYGTDGHIIFVSDRPRDGLPHTYPQLDEYELAPTNTGVWSLDPANGNLKLLNHAPSGDFTPIIDSFGRVLFTQWDHLQRDQQADGDSFGTPGSTCGSAGTSYGTFNYSNESASATPMFGVRTEVFPEPRPCRGDLLAGTNLRGHTFNHFFPWQIREDGSESEVLNHLGRHELHSYFEASFTNDANLEDFYGQMSRFNANSIQNFMMIAEDPSQAGRYYGINAPEFGTHASGQIVSLNAPPTTNADHIAVTYVTHPDTYTGTNSANQSGRYRDILALADGSLVAAHSTFYGQETQPTASYNFRLKTLSVGGNSYYAPNQNLTGASGIVESVSWWSPDSLMTYNGALWELNPVEVRARTIPTAAPHTLPSPEQAVFDASGVNVQSFSDWLVQNNLAVMVVRNVTTRDDFDFQQPFNLQVPGGVQTVNPSKPSPVYDVSFLQIFQGDLLRGWTGGYGSTPRPGRRVLGQVLHSDLGLNPLPNGASAGSVQVFPDGSSAAFVPANRALSWQLNSPSNVGVVRERYWITFQAGEIRVCGSCHGPSEFLQNGQAAATNQPQALADLLENWQILQGLNEVLYLPIVLK